MKTLMEDYTPTIGDYWGYAGKNVAFFGGTSDLAFPVMEAMVRMGANVHLFARSRSKLSKVVERLATHRQEPATINSHICDVCSTTSVRASADSYRDVTNCMDVAMWFIGHIEPESNALGGDCLEDVTGDGMVAQFESDYAGFQRMVHHFVPFLAKSAAPSMVVTDSIAPGRDGGSPTSNTNGGYSAAIAARRNQFKGYAYEFSTPRTEPADKARPRIMVNAVAPGIFLTNLNRKAFFVDHEADTPTAPTDRGRRAMECVPIGRVGNPVELVDHYLLQGSRKRNDYGGGAIVTVDATMSLCPAM